MSPRAKLTERLQALIPDGKSAEVARRAGLSRRTLTRWRQGQNDDARLSSLEAVARVLRVPLGDLLGIEAPPAADPRVDAAMQALRNAEEATAQARLLLESITTHRAPDETELARLTETMKRNGW